LNNPKNDPRLQEKYGQQLKETCDRICCEKSDLQVVGARFDEIDSAMKKKN
jgi:hypothetical protein